MKLKMYKCTRCGASAKSQACSLSLMTSLPARPKYETPISIRSLPKPLGDGDASITCRTSKALHRSVTRSPYCWALDIAWRKQKNIML